MQRKFWRFRDVDVKETSEIRKKLNKKQVKEGCTQKKWLNKIFWIVAFWNRYFVSKIQ